MERDHPIKIEDKEGHSGSKKDGAYLVLKVRDGFMVKVNLGKLCKGYELDMRSEMIFLSGDDVSEYGDLGKHIQVLELYSG